MAVMVPSEGKDLLHLMLSDNFAVGRASALTHEQTDTCAPFPAVTMATLTGRGILSARGGAVRAARRGVALAAHPSASSAIHTQTHARARKHAGGKLVPRAHRERHMCHAGKQK